ncbi:hypothetical protein BG003_004042 [Podila horticola]|nr:hypothetical protein BG003_004042 [Podila horticola]
MDQVFTIELPTAAKGIHRITIPSKDCGNFDVLVCDTGDEYCFDIQTESPYFTSLQKYKRCSFAQPDRQPMIVANLEYRFFGFYKILSKISKKNLVAKDNLYKIQFRFSSTAPYYTPAPDVNYPNTMMKRLLKDKAGHDVFFHFESDLVTTVAAHKCVLSQWSYFKTMFESGFEEGGSGIKPIHIKNVKPSNFKLLLRFIYIGNVESTAADLYDSDTGRASWEGVYIAADRYMVDDLRTLALVNIEAMLETVAVVDFLFRSAYQYKELRCAVIKYLANRHCTEINLEQVCAQHKDHPELAELVGELYSETVKTLRR